MTYIILSEQVERAEHLVVLDVERAGGLEVTLEGNGRRRLDVELLGGADLAKLLLPPWWLLLCWWALRCWVWCCAP
jgi:hypothetical protein